MTMPVSRMQERPIASALVGQLARRWWIPLLRGIAAIVFGVLAIVWPGQTLLTLVLIYGAFALLDGALAILGALLDRSGVSASWPVVLAGILGAKVRRPWPIAPCNKFADHAQRT